MHATTQKRFSPVGPVEVKRGPCRLCGQVRKLTKTHVPPEAMGNSGQRRAVIERKAPDGTPYLDLGSPREGGIWLRRLCEVCNNRTGAWDERFLEFQKALLGHVHDPARRPAGQLAGEFSDVSPGAFIRSVWAGMFAIDAISRNDYPALAASVLTGEPVAPPAEVRLLVALTKSLRIFVSSQVLVEAFSSSTRGEGWHQHRSGLVAPAPEQVDIPLAVINAPPFNFVLVGASHRYALPHEDLGAWLGDAARDRRSTPVLLPMVRIRDGNTPVSYFDLAPAVD